MPFETFEATMWQLAQRYTGKVGYRRGVKSEGLRGSFPLIDCSGWVGLVLSEAMEAENIALGLSAFSATSIASVQTWSDRIIDVVHTRTHYLLQGEEVCAQRLPRSATIGLRMGVPSWANNYPRIRGITHIAQVVHSCRDDAAFVSEAYGGSERNGLLLAPLAEWLDLMHPYVRNGDVWVVDPSLMALNRSESSASDDAVNR